MLKCVTPPELVTGTRSACNLSRSTAGKCLMLPNNNCKIITWITTWISDCPQVNVRTPKATASVPRSLQPLCIAPVDQQCTHSPATAALASKSNTELTNSSRPSRGHPQLQLTQQYGKLALQCSPVHHMTCGAQQSSHMPVATPAAAHMSCQACNRLLCLAPLGRIFPCTLSGRRAVKVNQHTLHKSHPLTVRLCLTPT